MIEYPKINEVIICKIHKITDFGVFVTLLEYDDVEGFVHLSQISSTWIKNIHNHVKQNQIRAAKVLYIDSRKNHIDLSFNRISDAEEKRKISEYRLFKRALGLMKVIGDELKLDSDKAWKEIAEPLINKTHNLYEGFVNIVKYGVDFYPEINEKYAAKLEKILSKSITVKDKKIITELNISCAQENGIEIIRKNLLKVLKDHSNVSMHYLAPGKYEMTIVAKDYKIGQRDYLKVSKQLEKSFKNCDFEILTSDKLRKETRNK